MRDPAKLRLVAETEDLAVETYFVTRNFPASERFGLTAQIRRAAVSVGSNIVEGSQRQGNRAFIAYLHQSLGSAAEVQFQLRVALRVKFGNDAAIRDLIDHANHVQRMIARLIVFLRAKGD
ncbi:MAG TPA: four helix bundle protein [Gemmatimonadaceae bacterium]